MTDAESLLRSRFARSATVIGGILVAGSILLFWFLANIFFDRWGVGGFGPTPFLPYPLVSHSPSYNFATWSGLFYLYALIGIPIGVVISGELFYTLWKWRDTPKRNDAPDMMTEGKIPDRTRGNKSRTLILTNIFIAILLFSLTAYSIPLNNTLLGPPPSSNNATVIEVYGYQFGWKFVYPNNNSTDKPWLPIGQEIVFKVTSLDVMHDFAIPSLRVKVDAYPGHWNTAYMIIYTAGNYTVFCMELCGIGHAGMIATIHAVPQAEYMQWYRSALRGT